MNIQIQPINTIQSLRSPLARSRGRRGFFLLTLFTAVFVLCAGAGPRKQGTPQLGLAFSVNSSGDEDDALVGDNLCETATGECTLRAAIEETNFRATGEDGIFIEAPQIILPRMLPDLTTAIEIVGGGPDQTTVKRDIFFETPFFHIFNVTVPSPGLVLFSGMTISQGGDSGVDGGAIKNNSSGTVNVTNCVISDNFGRHGGGISNNSIGTINVGSSTLTDNNAEISGGGVFNDVGTVNVDTSSLSSNSALANVGDSPAFGGGIANNTGTVNVTNSTLTGNQSVVERPRQPLVAGRRHFQ
jgi:hypothetical protein